MVNSLRQEKIERFTKQMQKAIEMLKTQSLENYLNALQYAYSLSIRYESVSLKNLVDSVPNDKLNKCLQAGILTEWNDTYWFNKEKAESLKLFIQEHKSC